MNRKEKGLIIKCLTSAVRLFSLRSCNDPPEDWFDGWSQEELIEFDRETNIQNNTPNEHDPEQPTAHYCDWLVMSVLARKIQKELFGDQG